MNPRGRNRANRLVESISALCRRFPTQEKWLVVPDYRLGYQWLENVALGGVPVFNLRLVTLPSLALRLASRAMREAGRRYLQSLEYELLVGEVMTRALSGQGYLPRGKLDPDLVKAVRKTISDLRTAGLRAKDLDPRAFSPPEKGQDLAALLSGLEEQLERRKLMDYADVLREARCALRGGESPLPSGLRLALPRDMESRLLKLERELWEALPGPSKEALETDDTGQPEEVEGRGDAALLAWLSMPYQAPRPTGDGSVDMFRAVGETNEVRQALRRCLKEGIPADRVEILHTDYRTYVPRILELCSLLFPENAEGPPVTFSEGIPLSLTRPGRAMLGWISWIREDFSRERLAELVQDGLLFIASGEEDESHFARLAATLRRLPLWRGREGYEALYQLPCPTQATKGVEFENGEGSPRIGPTPGREELEDLRTLCAGLLATVPEDPSHAQGLLEGAEDFVSRWVRALDKADQYALHLLQRRVRELRRFIQDSEPFPFPVLDWLEDTIRGSRVLGEGPRPGRLHVAPLGGGGSSGRPLTFILGLDDGRFPGAGLQDPFLLDAERERLSPSLPTASGRLAASTEELSRLFARLRGGVVLSYSGFSVGEDRETYPSQALVTSFRILAGSTSSTLDDFLCQLPNPASFVALDPDSALLPSEWWVCSLCRDRATCEPDTVLSASFPHLWRGLQAAWARQGDDFTSYDGYVPEAGRDLDLAAEGGPLASPNRLESYGKCPLEYFFRYVLEITPPEEYALDPATWLSPLERGSLLHSLFHRFHRKVLDLGRKPSMEEDWTLLKMLLDEEISRWREMKPPHSFRVLEEEARELETTARIFLLEEEKSFREREPLYLEVSVGMEREGAGNPVDHPEPLEVHIPGVGCIRVRGRIDRIDRLREEGDETFLVCDYKTGSSKSFGGEDPFRGGRCIQNYLYLVMAESCLRGVHPEAKISGFEYYFPSTREHGERISWKTTELSGGGEVIRDLYLSLAAGCFPASDDEQDLRYSDYLPAFGDPKVAASCARRKLENVSNKALEFFRRLRGYGEESS